MGDLLLGLDIGTTNTQAVVYDPTRNELFTATRGRGAYLNDRRIRVSRRSKLQESLIGTGFPFRKLEHLDEYVRMFKLITEQTAGIRRPGAAAMAAMAGMSAAWPYRCTGRMAAVRGVIAASIAAGSIVSLRGSMSANTGRAPVIMQASAV